MSEEKRTIDWAAIRAEYEDGQSLRALAAKYGVSKSVIGKRKYEEKWDEVKKHRTTINTQSVIHPDLNATVRAYNAFKLRYEKHLTWEEVATQSGFASRGAARNAVKREMDRRITHDIKQLRDEELYQITQLQNRCYDEGIDPTNDGWTWAIDRFTALSKRKSELMNLDKRPDEDAEEQEYVKKIVLTHQTSVEVTS